MGNTIQTTKPKIREAKTVDIQAMIVEQNITINKLGEIVKQGSALRSTEDYELIVQELADARKTLDELQASLDANTEDTDASENSNIIANQDQPTTTSSAIKEAFANEEMIKPILLTSGKSYQFSQYANLYNQKLALLDDPNSKIKNTFDTYIHLQNKKIDTLKQDLYNLENNLQDIKHTNIDIKAIKSMDTSQILNLETYNNKNRNNSSVYPNYLVYGNNGCLQYEKTRSNTNTNVIEPASWSFKSCNANNTKQQFISNKVNDLNTYNSYIKDPNNSNSILTDNTNVLFGFNVVNPIGAPDQCLQLNNDGLSIMPCDLSYSQRFKPFYNTVEN